MDQRIDVSHHRLEFKRPSGTSRGILKTKDSWYITAPDGRMGEVSIIEGLSRRSFDDYATLFTKSQLPEDPSEWPALRFAMEMIELGKAASPFHLFDTLFYAGHQRIPINGLIWMGSRDYMYEQIKAKLAEGYRCLKLKIGAIDFAEELTLLDYVRQQFSATDVEIRVDANGAFSPDDALEKLHRLAEYDLHSIEQPIRPDQIEDMARLCATTPLPIALDEELITPRYSREQKYQLLETVRPQYIILKPSLIGGITQSDEWISVATSLDIGWWATSALESNIGLNAIAQWVSQYDTDMYQGLGTGQLYTNNVPSPLSLQDGHIIYDPQGLWGTSIITNRS